MTRCDDQIYHDDHEVNLVSVCPFTDKAGIQFKVLNKKKGPAVWVRYQNTEKKSQSKYCIATTAKCGIHNFALLKFKIIAHREYYIHKWLYLLP